MRKTIYLIVLFFLALSVNAYAISELEKVYKDRLEDLNSTLDIGLHFKLKLNELDHKYAITILNNCEEYRNSKQCLEEKRALEKVDNEKVELLKRKEDILRQKAELKIKVVEKFGKLPAWWRKVESSRLKLE